jgi:hypothetical protein
MFRGGAWSRHSVMAAAGGSAGHRLTLSQRQGVS